MPKYLINAGNSTDGPVGFVLELTAATRNEALALAQEHLPDMLQNETHINGHMAELRVYFNTTVLTDADVAEMEED